MLYANCTFKPCAGHADVRRHGSAGKLANTADITTLWKLEELSELRPEHHGVNRLKDII